MRRSSDNSDESSTTIGRVPVVPIISPVNIASAKMLDAPFVVFTFSWTGRGKKKKPIARELQASTGHGVCVLYYFCALPSAARWDSSRLAND